MSVYAVVWGLLYLVVTQDLLPPPALLLFHTLEYILTAKRAHILAKEIFETYEFALVDPSVPSVRLNSTGEELVEPFIKHVLKAAFSTFLVPYAPATGIDGMPHRCHHLHSQISCASLSFLHMASLASPSS